MNRIGVGSLLAILFTSGAHGQTGCATKHPEPGVFVCYPNPSEHKEDGEIGTAFHVSAQVNAPKGRKIGRFVLLIDDSQVYQSRLAMPLEQLSIEVNVKSPFLTSTHTIQLIAD